MNVLIFTVDIGTHPDLITMFEGSGGSDLIQPEARQTQLSSPM